MLAVSRARRLLQRNAVSPRAAKRYLATAAAAPATSTGHSKAEGTIAAAFASLSGDAELGFDMPPRFGEMKASFVKNEQHAEARESDFDRYSRRGLLCLLLKAIFCDLCCLRVASPGSLAVRSSEASTRAVHHIHSSRSSHPSSRLPDLLSLLFPLSLRVGFSHPNLRDPKTRSRHHP